MTGGALKRARRSELDPARTIVDLAPELDPKLWRIRVQDMAATVDEYLPWPPDGDFLDAIRTRFGSGRFRVRLIRRAGRSVRHERDRLGIERTRAFELVDVPPAAEGPPPAAAAVDDDDGEDGAAPPAPSRSTRPRLVDDEDEAVRKERREAARIEAECERIEAEAKLRKLKLGLAGPTSPADPSAAVAALLEQQAKLFADLLARAEAREARLAEQLLQARQAPAPAAAAPGAAPAAGLEGLKGTLALVREVLAVADQFRGEAADVGDDDSAAGGVVKVLREAKGLLSVLPPMGAGAGRHAAAFARSEANLKPGPKPAAAPKLPAPGDAAAKARHRVEAFLAQLVEEATLGSSPETVADALADSVGLLPAAVRSPLDAGDWRAAWTACAQLIGAEKWNELDASLAQSAEVQQWLEAFAAACVQEDEPTEGEDDAEG